MPSPRKTRSLTVAHGEIDASDKTTSLLFPSREHGPWLPFERFAETMTTSRTKRGRHSPRGDFSRSRDAEGETSPLVVPRRPPALAHGTPADHDPDQDGRRRHRGIRR